MPLDPLGGRIKVRDLIEGCVREEWELRQRPRIPVFQNSCGCCGCGNWILIDPPGSEPGPEGAIERALSAFVRDEFEIFLDGRKIGDLNESVELSFASDLVFLPRRRVRGL